MMFADCGMAVCKHEKGKKKKKIIPESFHTNI